MYQDEFTAIPKDEEHFWEMAEDNYYFARDILRNHPLETKEQALARTDREPLLVLSYRGTSKEMDQRDYFYEMGNSLLPIIEKLLEKRELSPEFVQEWGKLMFCHGYLASYAFDDTDPVANSRAALVSAEKRDPTKHKRWLAHIFALPQFSKLSRHDADAEVAEFLVRIQKNPRTYRYPKGWFDKILISEELRSTFQEKNFSLKKMAELRLLGTKDLPPIPKIPS